MSKWGDRSQLGTVRKSTASSGSMAEGQLRGRSESWARWSREEAGAVPSVDTPGSTCQFPNGGEYGVLAT